MYLGEPFGLVKLQNTFLLRWHYIYKKISDQFQTSNFDQDRMNQSP